MALRAAKTRQTWKQKVSTLTPKVVSVAIIVNRYLFAPLVVLAIGTFAIDAATYPGFVYKTTKIPPIFFLALAVVSYCLLVFRKFFFDEKFKPEALLVLRANLLALPLAFFLQGSLLRLEAENYPNYVFSTFHLNLSVLQQVINFSTFLAIPYLLTGYLNIKPIIWPRYGRWLTEQNLAAFILGLSLVIYSAAQLNNAFVKAGKDTVAILRTPDASLTDRRVQVIGEVYNVYQFYNQHIDETATVAVPPQRMSGTIGNVGYSRYFMYPRYLIHEEDFVPEQLPEVDYFVITRSSFDDATQKVVMWPDKPIIAEAIHLYDEETMEQQSFHNIIYSPENPAFFDKWGVIKVAKN